MDIASTSTSAAICDGRSIHGHRIHLFGNWHLQFWRELFLLYHLLTIPTSSYIENPTQRYGGKREDLPAKSRSPLLPIADFFSSRQIEECHIEESISIIIDMQSIFITHFLQSRYDILVIFYSSSAQHYFLQLLVLPLVVNTSLTLSVCVFTISFPYWSIAPMITDVTSYSSLFNSYAFEGERLISYRPALTTY